MSFAEYLTALEKMERGEDLPAAFVPCAILGGFVKEELVGMLAIRLKLNDHLLREGGHIGYGVLPEFRRRGFAKAMLAQALPIARQAGISKALVTCDDDNPASAKTIESCGGALENKVETAPGKPLKRRYWITPPNS
jgi:predicted acetyltransferase